jgi:hypothetical protein
LAIVGAALGLYATHVVPLPAWYLGWKGGNPSWMVVSAAAALAIGLTARGVCRFRRWAMWLSLAQGLGLFECGRIMWGLAKFYWGSYESFVDRIEFLHLPELAAYLVFPVAWMAYLALPSVRTQFHHPPV